MKFLLALTVLISVSTTTIADDYNLSSRAWCYYIVDPIVYGNPVEGGVEDVEFPENQDRANSESCFNILKWMVLPEDGIMIGEIGSFIYRNPKTNYKRQCKYEVVERPDLKVKENLKDILMTTSTIEELTLQFNEYESALNKSVEVTCEFVGL